MGILSILRGKSEEQRQLEREKRDKEQRLESEILDAMRSIRIFPGSKMDYEEKFGVLTAIVDLGCPDIGLYWNKGFYERGLDPFYLYHPDFKKQMVDQGVIALVNAAPVMMSNDLHISSQLVLYGLPIKKVNTFT